ncbi:MAG: glycosyltransferase [Planctomycetes bacterium]|nr:glycosyltransferase [Planctomycetota bacterium]MCG2684008.1 glycosyltransferase [Planctomycetales bacterium]
MLSRAQYNPVDVSVLVATRNRAALLAQTLESLTRQKLGDITWEVIVVDNGSQDDTPRILSHYQNRLPLVPLEETTPGKNRALNKALEVARGTMLLFTDDDVVVDPGWVREMCAAAERWPEQTILAGAIAPLFEDLVPEWIRSTHFRYRRLAFCGFRPREQEGYIEQRAFGANFALHRSSMQGMTFCETIGPQGTRIYAVGSETELFIRLESRGMRTVFIPDAHVQHIITVNHARIRSLMQRAFRAGRSDIALGGFLGRTFIAGIPTHLWKELFRTALSSLLSVPCRQLTRLECRMDLWRTWGRIYQCRINRHSFD